MKKNGADRIGRPLEGLEEEDEGGTESEENWKSESGDIS